MTSEETVSEEARRETERPSPWKTFTVCSNSMCKFESLARWQDASPPLGGGGEEGTIMCFIIIVQLRMCVHLCVCSLMCSCVCVCVSACVIYLIVCVHA